MQELIRSLVSRGPELNREWLSSTVGRAHWLSPWIRMLPDHKRDNFVDTNCDTTAMMLRTKLAPAHTEAAWIVSAVPPPNDCRVFQVSIGPEPDGFSVEHWVTVVGNSVLHSWGHKHPLQELVMHSRIRGALIYPGVDVEVVFLIIGSLDAYADIPNKEALKVWYWVPPSTASA